MFHFICLDSQLTNTNKKSNFVDSRRLTLMACEEILFVTAERHGWLMKVSHLHWLKAMNIQEVLTYQVDKIFKEIG